MMKYLASNHVLAGKKRYFSVTSSGTRKISLFPISKSLENLSFFLSSLFRFLPYTGPIKTEEGETDMNGWDLAEVLFPVLGMVAAVNLLIQFFQIAWEEFRRCSIIRAERNKTRKEQKKSEIYGDDRQLWKFRQERTQELF